MSTDMDDMKELIADTNREMRATTSKERAVWNALETLYFEEKFPFASITFDMIREKRKELEGSAGDPSGLGKMRERFRIKHNIDPDHDPNCSHSQVKPNTDPLFAVTQKIRDEIKRSLEIQMEAERNQLVSRIQEAENKLSELEIAHAALREQYVNANNERQLLKEQLVKARDSELVAITKFETTESAFIAYKENFELWLRDKIETQQQVIADLSESHQATVQKISDSHAQEIKALVDNHEAVRNALELSRQNSLQEFDNLRVENTKLKAEQAQTKDIINIFNGQLANLKDTVSELTEKHTIYIGDLQDAVDSQKENILETMETNRTHLMTCITQGFTDIELSIRSFDEKLTKSVGYEVNDDK